MMTNKKELLSWVREQVELKKYILHRLIQNQDVIKKLKIGLRLYGTEKRRKNYIVDLLSDKGVFLKGLNKKDVSFIKWQDFLYGFDWVIKPKE